MKNIIKCLSFLTGETLICKLNEDIIINAFYIETFTDRESRERSFVFKPLLKCNYEQNLSKEESKKNLINSNMISSY